MGPRAPLFGYYVMPRQMGTRAPLFGYNVMPIWQCLYIYCNLFEIHCLKKSPGRTKWVGPLGALAKKGRTGTDPCPFPDPNGPKTDQKQVRLGRRVGDGLSHRDVHENEMSSSMVCLDLLLPGFRSNPSRPLLLISSPPSERCWAKTRRWMVVAARPSFVAVLGRQSLVRVPRLLLARSVPITAAS